MSRKSQFRMNPMSVESRTPDGDEFTTNALFGIGNDSETEPRSTSMWSGIKERVNNKVEDRKFMSEVRKSAPSRLLDDLVSKFTGDNGEVDPRKVRLVKAIQKREEQNYEDFWDKLENEFFITGQIIFEFFTPGDPSRNKLIWTITYTLVNIMVFVFMAADYQWWLYSMALQGDPFLCPPDQPFNIFCTGISNCMDTCESDIQRTGIKNSTIAYSFNLEKSSPKRALAWLEYSFKVGDTKSTDYVNYHFAADYLVIWGGKYIPSIMKCDQWWRWLSSICVHHSIGHLFSNFLLFFFLAACLESKYGTWRIDTFICIMSGVVGNFLSTPMDQNPCLVVVGASGACYGMIGLFVADMVLNYESIQRPIIRIIVVTIFFIFNLVMVHNEKDVSHTSHLGGFLVGLFPSFLFLPNFKSERWESLLPPLGFLTLVGGMIALPAIIYETFNKNDLDFKCRQLYEITQC